MKKHFIQSLIVLSTLFFISCSSENEPSKPEEITPELPTVDFIFTGNDKPAPTTIIFENKSKNATDYLWDFGDEGSSLEKNPTHIYATGGTFTIKLIATGVGGSVMVEKNITVASPPHPTTVKITKITLTEMPFKDEFGNDWDSAQNGPDVQFFIVDAETYKDQVSSIVFNNILKSQLPLSWTLETPKLFSDLSKEYNLSISEIDGQLGNTIGADISLKMSDYITGSNPYPKTITLMSSGENISNKVTFILELTWL